MDSLLNRVRILLTCSGICSEISPRFNDENGQYTEEFGPNDVCFELEEKIFIQAIRTKDPGLIRSDYADSLKTMEVTFAAMKSLQNNNEVIVL